MYNPLSVKTVTLLFFVLLATLICSSPATLASVSHDKIRVRSFSDLPPGLAPVLAGAMQSKLSAAYRWEKKWEKSGSSFLAANPAHNMCFSFNSTSARIRGDDIGWTWFMTLTGLGYAGAVQPVAAAEPAIEEGRLIYHRSPGLSEWYLNSGLGLEQGFTLHAPPDKKHQRGSLQLELILAGTLRPFLEGDTLLLQDDTGRPQVRYTGLHVFDADGKSLPASLALAGSLLRIIVDDSSARYPVTIDPWIQQARLTASDGTAGDVFGFSVAISGDTVVVGAYAEGDIELNSGSAYVFVKGGSGWATMTETAKLTASDGAADDIFGYSVAVSGDTVVVGTHLDDVGVDNDQGSAYVFEKPGSGWANMTETAKLTASDGAGYDEFAFSVAISGDTVVVGSPYDDVGSNYDLGSAYVFEKPGSGWATMTETAKLIAFDGVGGDVFGFSVAISGDTVVAGALYDEVDSNNNQGSAYVYEKPGSVWATMTETAKLTASDGAGGDQLGTAVAISGDTVVVGAPYDNGTVADPGSAYVFVKGSGWTTGTETAKLIASDGALNDHFGLSVAIDNDTAVIGAPTNKDSAYIFVKPGSGWINTSNYNAKLTAKAGSAHDGFGNSVAISGDAVAVGAYIDNSLTGAAYVYASRPNGANSIPGILLLLLGD